MADHLRQLANPDFQQLLARRSRLRWSLTLILVVAYLGYGVGGLYARDLMGMPFGDGSMPRGLILGYAIIALAIGLSLFYIWRVNQLVAYMKSAVGTADAQDTQ